MLRAPSSALSAALVAKMNVLWGLDVPFYIAHNTGLHLGNYARNDGNGGDGKAVQAFPRPTIDQIMAWSPSFYSNLSSIRERAMIMVEPAGVVELHRSVDDRAAASTTCRGYSSSLRSVQQDLRPDDRRRAGAARADRRPRARQLQPAAQRQHAAVGGRQAAPGRSHRAHRRAAAQADDDGQRRVLLDRHRRRPTTPTSTARNTAADAGKQLQLWNEVAAAAFMCGTSRIGVLALRRHLALRRVRRRLAPGGRAPVAARRQAGAAGAVVPAVLRVGAGRHGEAPRQRRGGARADLPRQLAAGLDAGVRDGDARLGVGAGRDVRQRGGRA